MATQQQQPAKRCPLCGLREHAAVSDESRRRDVSLDTWSITPKGTALLATLALRTHATERATREQAYWFAYHTMPDC